MSHAVLTGGCIFGQVGSLAFFAFVFGRVYAARGGVIPSSGGRKRANTAYARVLKTGRWPWPNGRWDGLAAKYNPVQDRTYILGLPVSAASHAGMDPLLLLVR